VEQELIHDQVAAYVLDALDDSERREFEEHLADCEQCSSELEGLQDAATALAYVPEGPAPSPGLRERLLERVHAETTRVQEAPAAAAVPRRRRLFAPVLAGLAVGAVAAAIVLGLWA
jgi:anti-sigma factor RsiW